MHVRPVVATLTLLLIAGCGGSSDGPEAPTRTTASTDPSAGPTPTQKGVELTGVVGEADENGCLTLTTSDSKRTTWLLVGSTSDLGAGDRVTVRGSPAPDLATRCQQGTPFVVEAVEPG